MEPNLQKQKVILGIEETELEAKEFVESYSKFQRWLLIVLLVLAIPVYFGAKHLTAGLYYNNFEKSAVVAHQANLVTLAVQIVESKILPVSANNYSAYALIKNQNSTLITPRLDYAFTFIDSSGASVGTFSGNDFLLAGQTKYLIAPNVTLTGTPAQLKVEVSQPVWQNRIQTPDVPIDNGVPTYADSVDPAGFAIDGALRNQSSFTLGAVVIKGIVHAKDDSVIAVISRMENTVSPQQLRAYHLFWPRFLQNSTGRVEVDVETNPFDPNNLK